MAQPKGRRRKKWDILARALKTLGGALQALKPALRPIGIVLKHLADDFNPESIRVVEGSRVKRVPYRGFIHYGIDKAEKFLAMAVVAYLVYAAIQFGTAADIGDLSDELNNVTTILAAFLIIDAGLRIAELIDEPGVEETLGALMVALAGGTLLVLKEATKPTVKNEFEFTLEDAGGIGILVALIVALFILRIVWRWFEVWRETRHG